MTDHGAAARADVLLLGTFHMANPGRDVVNLVVDDMLAPHRQAELDEIAEALARFEPNKVCVEVAPASQAVLDARYRAHRDGHATPSPDEIVQIAFRVAQARGLERVHGIDDHTPMDWDGYESVRSRDPREARRFDAWLERARAETRALSDRFHTVGIRDHLRRINEEEALRNDHAFYVDLAGAGSMEEHGGADTTVGWYARNIRIFSNLCSVTEPRDRIFVLFGAGHVPILRHLLAHSSRHRLVDPLPYLA